MMDAAAASLTLSELSEDWSVSACEEWVSGQCIVTSTITYRDECVPEARQFVFENLCRQTQDELPQSDETKRVSAILDVLGR